MPLSNEHLAPRFDPREPRTLDRYFLDLEMLFGRAGIQGDAERKQYGLLYVPLTVADQWELLATYSPPHSYTSWKSDVYRLYPGACASAWYTRQGLLGYVQYWRARGFRTLGDWAEFFRSFRTQSTWLIQHGKISSLDQDRWCMEAVSSELPRIALRLQIKSPEVGPSESYSMEVVNEAMLFLLHETSAAPSVPTSLSPPTHPTPRSMRSDLRPDDQQALRQPPEAFPHWPTSSSFLSIASSCHYCGKLGCRVRSCVAAREDLQAGRIQRNPAGQLVLPSGRYIPRSLPGSCMRERVAEWHNCRSDVAGPPLLQSWMYAEASRPSFSCSPSTPYAVALQDRIRVLEREVQALRQEQSQQMRSDFGRHVSEAQARYQEPSPTIPLSPHHVSAPPAEAPPSYRTSSEVFPDDLARASDTSYQPSSPSCQLAEVSPVLTAATPDPSENSVSIPEWIYEDCKALVAARIKLLLSSEQRTAASSGSSILAAATEPRPPTDMLEVADEFGDRSETKLGAGTLSPAISSTSLGLTPLAESSMVETQPGLGIPEPSTSPSAPWAPSEVYETSEAISEASSSPLHDLEALPFLSSDFGLSPRLSSSRPFPTMSPLLVTSSEHLFVTTPLAAPVVVESFAENPLLTCRTAKTSLQRSKDLSMSGGWSRAMICLLYAILVFPRLTAHGRQAGSLLWHGSDSLLCWMIIQCHYALRAEMLLVVLVALLALTCVGIIWRFKRGHQWAGYQKGRGRRPSTYNGPTVFASVGRTCICSGEVEDDLGFQ